MSDRKEKNITIYFKDKELLQKGKEKAKREDRTFSSYIATLIRKDLAKEE